MKQEHGRFDASLDHKVRPCLKNKEQNKIKTGKFGTQRSSLFRTYTATVDLIPNTELERKGEKRGRREGGQMGLGTEPRTQGDHLGRVEAGGRGAAGSQATLISMSTRG